MTLQGASHDRARDKDWFWPWVLGAGILLVVGGIGIYLLRGRRRSRKPSSTRRRPSSTRPHRRRRPSSTPRRRPRARCRCRRSTRATPTCSADLTELFGQDAVAQHLVPERIVRNIVVTIDNMPRQQMALNQRPMQPTPGDFITSGRGGRDRARARELTRATSRSSRSCRTSTRRRSCRSIAGSSRCSNRRTRSSAIPTHRSRRA